MDERIKSEWRRLQRELVQAARMAKSGEEFRPECRRARAYYEIVLFFRENPGLFWRPSNAVWYISCFCGAKAAAHTIWKHYDHYPELFGVEESDIIARVQMSSLLGCFSKPKRALRIAQHGLRKGARFLRNTTPTYVEIVEYAHLCCVYLGAYHQINGFDDLEEDQEYQQACGHAYKVALLSPEPSEFLGLPKEFMLRLADVKEDVGKLLVRKGGSTNRSRGLTLQDEAYHMRRQ